VELAGDADFTVQSGGESFDLNPGENHSVSIKFTPSSAGGKTATLSLINNVDGKSPFNVDLQGNGIAPDITVSPYEWNYGDIPVGSYSDKLFTISNPGSAVLVISAELTGNVDFTIQGTETIFNLDPGASRDIVVRFEPSALGDKSAVLSLLNNVDGKNPFDIPLAGASTGVLQPDISVEPVSWDYGYVDTGGYSDKTFTISNTGSAVLVVTATVTGDPDFSLLSSLEVVSLDPGETCEATIRFAPSSTGSKSAILSLASNVDDKNPLDVAIEGIGAAPNIVIEPTLWNYGDVLLGDYLDKAFQVSNPGNSVLNVAAVNLTGDSDFAIQSGGGSFSVNPGETHNIVIRFTPVLAEIREAVLNIDSNVSAKSPLSVSLQGTGAIILVPDISVSPNSWDYGDVMLGDSPDQTFTVSNLGNVAFSITEISISGDSDFSIQSEETSFTLDPGQTQDILVRFAPESMGEKTGTLCIANSVDVQTPLEIMLQGNGIMPDIVVEPASWDGGDVLVGEYSDQAFTVSNPGNSLLDVTAVNLTGDNDFSIQNGGESFNLNPGETHNIVIRFAPVSFGAKSATLRITNNVDDKNPLDVMLQGNGIAPDIAVEPTSWDCGEVLLGSCLEQAFTVSNMGNAILDVTSIQLTGDPSFSIQSGGEAFSLNPGETHDILVSFNPDSVGVKVATLSITSNSVGESLLNIQMQGNGNINPVPDITIAPVSWDYGDVQVGNTVPQIFTLSNPGNAVLNVTAVNLTGDGDFSIQSGGEAFSLNPGETHDIIVRFSPLLPQGGKTAVLSFANNVVDKNPLNVPLQGNSIVVAGPDISSDPEEWDYGIVVVGSYSSKLFQISNPGEGLLEVSDVDITGDTDFIILSGKEAFSLNPGETHDIVVSLKPMSSDEKTAEISLQNNVNGKSPFNIKLQGMGTSPDITVIPEEWDYGDVALGKYEEKDFVITNKGSSQLMIGVLGLWGDKYFYIKSGRGKFYLDPGDTHTVTVRFAPRKGGDSSSRIIISTNVKNRWLIYVPLKGRGIPPSVVVTPTSWNFGTVAVQDSSDVTFTVANEGQTDFTIKDVKIEGCDEFSVENGDKKSNLEPGDSYEILVRFSPVSSGSKMGTLNISLDIEDFDSFEIALKGVGACAVTAISSDSHERDSLYKFRDKLNAKSDKGREFTDIYYEYSPEVSKILLKNPLLAVRSAAILLEVMPGIRFLTGEGEGRDIQMTSVMFRRIEELFEDIGKEGSQDLAKTLSMLTEWLEQYEGMRFSQIWDGMDIDIDRPSSGFVMMQNYPNPFNPETWIPYYLKEDVRVIIKIYTENGQLVRTLDLGHKTSGLYIAKEKAAYWDGKNEEGEQVSSGLYFCSIKAGEHTATMKMLITR
jgi:hypothetical protein